VSRDFLIPGLTDVDHCFPALHTLRGTTEARTLHGILRVSAEHPASAAREIIEQDERDRFFVNGSSPMVHG